MGVFLMGCPTVKEDTGPGPRVDIEEGASVTWTGGEELEEAGQGVAVLDDWNGAPAIAISAPGLKRVYVEPIPEPGEYVLPTGEGSLLDGSSYRYFGDDLTTVGDVTGDGAEDLAVTGNESGMLSDVHIVSGPTPDRTIQPGDLPVVEWTCRWAYTTAPSGGDVTGDGYFDLLVGCWDDDEDFVEVYEGPISGDHVTTKALTHFYSEMSERFGYSATLEGDLNGDGTNDIVIGADSNVYVFSEPARGDLSDTSADTNIDSGEVLTTGFDNNNDGYTDLLVSDPTWLPDPWDCKHEGVGAVWLYHGPLTGHLDAQDAAVATLRDTSMTWGSEECTDSIGSSLTHGDFNDDGQVDYAIGNTFAYTRPSVYIVRGPLSGAIELGEDSLGIEESYYSPYTAEVMETAVLDEDGSQDLLIGDPGWITYTSSLVEPGSWGAVYLYPGADITSLAGW